MGDFKPSEVDILGSWPPLCGTMKRTENETAAALVVRGLQKRDIEAGRIPGIELRRDGRALLLYPVPLAKVAT